MLKSNRHALFGAAAFAAAGTLAAPVPAAACSGDSPYMASVCFMANYVGGNQCPEGYLPADGRILQIANYQAVFALIGNRFGGNGTQTFALPDLRGRNIIGTGQGPGLPNVQVGQTGGAQTVALTANNLPPHTHPATFAGGPVSGLTVSVAIPAVTNPTNSTTQPGTTVNLANSVDQGGIGADVRIYSSDNPTTTTLRPFNATVSGSGTLTGTVTVAANPTTNTPVPVLDPFVGLVACFAVQGLFPTPQ